MQEVHSLNSQLTTFAALFWECLQILSTWAHTCWCYTCYQQSGIWAVDLGTSYGCRSSVSKWWCYTTCLLQTMINTFAKNNHPLIYFYCCIEEKLAREYNYTGRAFFNTPTPYTWCRQGACEKWRLTNPTCKPKEWKACSLFWFPFFS